METRSHGRRMDGRSTRRALAGGPSQGGLTQWRQTKANVQKSKPKGLLVALIRSQRVRGRTVRSYRRGRSAGGVRRGVPRRRVWGMILRTFCAILASCKPRAEAHSQAADLRCQGRAHFPSLRAHNPILPASIHRDHAGEILENPSLAVRSDRKTTPGATRAQSCLGRHQTPRAKARESERVN
jgi:hypothetical protein